MGTMKRRQAGGARQRGHIDLDERPAPQAGHPQARTSLRNAVSVPELSKRSSAMRRAHFRDRAHDGL